MQTIDFYERLKAVQQWRIVIKYFWRNTVALCEEKETFSFAS